MAGRARRISACVVVAFLTWIALVALVGGVVGALLGELHQPGPARGLPQVVGITRHVALALCAWWAVMVGAAGARNLLRA